MNKQIVDNAILNALNGESKLTNDVLEIEGMSSNNVRHFLNNLISSIYDVRYLEIGIWKGSTFISSLYKNTYTYATAIDNFCDFGSPREECKFNLKNFINAPNENTEFIESEFEKISFTKKYNIYFYDGEHDAISQENAFLLLNDNLDDRFIAIIDDWNHQPAKDGTLLAFEKLNYKIVSDCDLKSNGNADVNNWWNGLYVAIIEKNV